MTMTVYNTPMRVRKPAPTMELLPIEKRRALAEQLHSDRYERYRDKVAGHLDHKKRDAYAIKILMRERRKVGRDVGRMISETIGEDHDEFIMKLVDLGEPIQFINY